MSALRLGTRGSQLALAQSRAVAARLEAAHRSVRVELVEIRTSGDRIQDVPLGPALGQAFFTKEIEDALLDGRVDLAVHSCKDLPTVMPEGLVLGAVPERESPLDALVSASGRLADLPAGATVGTSSIRRRRFLAAARPDLRIVDMRGNVPRRLAAVDEGRCDAVVLAVAGLRRLGLEGRITEALDPSVMLPAVAQGALALQIREHDEVTRSLVEILDDAGSRAEVTAERASLRRLEAGCQAPVGALGRLTPEGLDLHVAVAAPQGIVETHVRGDAQSADQLGVSAAETVLSQLGLASLRMVDWAGAPPRRLEER